MRREMAFALAVVLSFSLWACGNASVSEPSTDGDHDLDNDTQLADGDSDVEQSDTESVDGDVDEGESDQPQVDGDSIEHDSDQTESSELADGDSDSLENESEEQDTETSESDSSDSDSEYCQILPLDKANKIETITVTNTCEGSANGHTNAGTMIITYDENAKVVKHETIAETVHSCMYYDYDASDKINRITYYHKCDDNTTKSCAIDQVNDAGLLIQRCGDSNCDGTCDLGDNVFVGVIGFSRYVDGSIARTTVDTDFDGTLDMCYDISWSFYGSDHVATWKDCNTGAQSTYVLVTKGVPYKADTNLIKDMYNDEWLNLWASYEEAHILPTASSVLPCKQEVLDECGRVTDLIYSTRCNGTYDKHLAWTYTAYNQVESVLREKGSEVLDCMHYDFSYQSVASNVARTPSKH